MLIKNRPEAGIVYEQTGDGGAGAGSSDSESSVTPAGGAGGAATPEQVQAQLAELQKELKIARREAKERREKLDAIEAADRERKDKELGEVESSKKRASELEAKLKDITDRHRADRIASAVTVAALKLDFIDAEDAAKLADLSAVEMTEDGKISGVEDALKALAKAKPHLIKQAGGGGDINARERGRQENTTKSAAQAVLDRAYAKPKERQ